MSRVFEALQQLNIETVSESGDLDVPQQSTQIFPALGSEVAGLNTVPQFALPLIPESRLAALYEPNSLVAEKLRGLAAKLRSAQNRKGIKKLLVASATHGDGKSMISANLALTFASRGERTLLIDGDLHKPSLHALLGIQDPVGFAEWAEKSASITDYLCREERTPLWFLAAGKCASQPLSRIESPATAELLRKLANWFDWIIIDSPPIVPLTDSSVWAAMCDSVLLLVREGVTAKRAFLKSVASLDKTKLFAVILNDANTKETKYYSRYYSGTADAKRSHSEA